MARYSVIIKETTSYQIFVTANNEDEAIDAASDTYECYPETLHRVENEFEIGEVKKLIIIDEPIAEGVSQ